MKKLLVVLGLAMAAFSFQASAAVLSPPLGLVSDFGSFNGVLGNGDFSDTITFSVPTNIGVAASVTNAFVSGKIANFAATLDGSALSLISGSTSQLLEILLTNLAAGSHSLIITGTSAGSYGGSINVDQTVVPVPAAVWLFGSALMGLMGVSRRKSA